MKRFLILSFVISAMAAMPAAAGDTTSYGDGVTLKEAVAIDTLLANPDDYIGRTVRVDGVITGVCKKRGCWMQVTDSESGNGVRINRGCLRGHQADPRADRGPQGGGARPRGGRRL